MPNATGGRVTKAAELYGLDLNLLLTLDVLLDECSVTRTAKRLRLAQPSVSMQLSKLRESFNDPLLVPTRRGMRPTPRAESLREPLRAVLSGLAVMVAPAVFEPAKARVTWRVAAADYGEIVVLVPALAKLRAEAPNARLAVVQTQTLNIERMLEAGEIDLCVSTVDSAPEQLRRVPLFTDRYVLVGRKGHPKLRRRPNLTQFCALEHVLMSPDGAGFVGPTDRALAEKGAKRNVALSVPHFSFSLAAIASSDLVAMLPSRLVAARQDLCVYEPPVAIEGFTMGLLWHDRSHHNPAHQWLRNTLVTTAKIQRRGK